MNEKLVNDTMTELGENTIAELEKNSLHQFFQSVYAYERHAEQQRFGSSERGAAPIEPSGS